MEEASGVNWPVFIGITLILMGFAAYMTGQALANTWRPMWQAVPYALLLGGADRFLVWGLFEGDLFSLSGYLLDTLLLLGICLLAYRLNRAYRMVAQYPWLYERSGLFSWRRKARE